MQNYLKITCFILSFLFLNFLVAQTSNEDNLSLISSKKLKEDFQFLKTGLEKTHAGLYIYTSKDSLDKILTTIESALHQPMTSINFYRKITPLLKLIGNGHTNFLVPPDYNKAINTTLPRFPFAVHWHQDTLYILRNLSNNETLEAGMIVKSINGESAVTVMQTLADNLTRDAQNDSWPKGKVVRDFSGKYAYFKGTPPIFKMEIVGRKGETIFLSIKGLTRDKITQHAKKRYPNWRKPPGKPLQFEIVDSIGKLTVRSFYLPAIRKAKQAYKAFFKSIFTQIENQKIKHLIIDIRDNGGGWPQVVNELFSYLINEPYLHKTTAYTITNKLPNQKHYEDGFWHFLDMRKSLKLKKDGTIYKVTGDKKHKVVQPAQNPFQGKIYVLTNPFTFSGATDFMGMLKNVNRGTFIGEIAGGNPHHNTAWIMPWLVLPNTKIEAILPVVGMQTVNNFPNDKQGMKPDFFVENNIEAELEGKDAAMQFLLHRIQQE